MHSTSKASFGFNHGTDRKARTVLPAVSPAARGASAGADDARGGALFTAKLAASGWEKMPELDEESRKAPVAKDKVPAVKERAPVLPAPTALPPEPQAAQLDDRVA